MKSVLKPAEAAMGKVVLAWLLPAMSTVGIVLFFVLFANRSIIKHLAAGSVPVVLGVAITLIVLVALSAVIYDVAASRAENDPT